MNIIDRIISAQNTFTAEYNRTPTLLTMGIEAERSLFNECREHMNHEAIVKENRFRGMLITVNRYFKDDAIEVHG